MGGREINVEMLMTNVFIGLLRKHFFYGSVLSQLNKVYTDKVSTLGVGKDSRDESLVKLYVNPEYVRHVCELVHRDEARVMDHFTEVLKHEVHHFIFSHLSLEMRNRRAQEIACELSVNSYVDRSKLIPDDGEKKAGVFPEDFGFPPRLSVFEYYRLLDSSNPPKGGGGSSNDDRGGKGDDSGDGGRKDSQDESSESSGGLSDSGAIDDHSMWVSMEGDKASEEMVRDIVRQANETCKKMGKWGDVPSELMDAIGKSYKQERNVIPWQVVLKNFFASSSENVLGYTMRKRSKRFGTRPGTMKEDVLSVGIGIDTSGSVDDDAISLFFSEMEWMRKSNSRITVFEWDTEVHREYPISEWDGKVCGRGGTDPVPALELMSERKFDCIVMFTDFGFPDIEKTYGIPMIWVVTDPFIMRGGLHVPVSEGMIFVINDDRDGFEVVRHG